MPFMYIWEKVQPDGYSNPTLFYGTHPRWQYYQGRRNLENNNLPLLTKYGYYDIVIDGVLDFYSNRPLTFVPFAPLSQTKHTLIWLKNHQPSPIAQAFIDDVTAKISTMPS